MNQPRRPACEPSSTALPQKTSPAGTAPSVSFEIARDPKRRGSSGEFRCREACGHKPPAPTRFQPGITTKTELSR
jgi:hypothetical protein